MTNEEMTRLLPLVRTGDERACEQLWHGLRIPVYTVAVRILDDRYLAEDVTQEVFVRLFRTPPGEEVHSPRAWVFAVTPQHRAEYAEKPPCPCGRAAVGGDLSRRG